ncbi:MAG: hypothetical protein RR293_07740 [Bacteroidales bacterium]
MNTTVLKEIIAFLLGRKYYANIINTRGTNKCEITSFIFYSRAEAAEHKKTIESTISFLYIETISFRSRRNYPVATINR